MSNAAYLIANDVPGGAAVNVGWGGAVSLADGPCAVPVFWLALFDEKDVVGVAVETEDGDELEIPSLVAELAEARRRLRERRELLTERFPEFEPTWREFDAALQGLAARFVKIDVNELWDLAAAVDEDFEDELRAALRWFEGRDEADFEKLLSIASIQGYDPAQKTFQAVDAEVPRAFHLRGYSSRPGWWSDEADV